MGENHRSILPLPVCPAPGISSTWQFICIIGKLFYDEWTHWSSPSPPFCELLYQANQTWGGAHGHLNIHLGLWLLTEVRFSQTKGWVCEIWFSLVESVRNVHWRTAWCVCVCVDKHLRICQMYCNKCYGTAGKEPWFLQPLTPSGEKKWVVMILSFWTKDFQNETCCILQWESFKVRNELGCESSSLVSPEIINSTAKPQSRNFHLLFYVVILLKLSCYQDLFFFSQLFYKNINYMSTFFNIFENDVCECRGIIY